MHIYFFYFWQCDCIYLMCKVQNDGMERVEKNTEKRHTTQVKQQRNGFTSDDCCCVARNRRRVNDGNELESRQKRLLLSRHACPYGINYIILPKQGVACHDGMASTIRCPLELPPALHF